MVASKSLSFISLFIAFFIQACSSSKPTFRIIEKPILFNEERETLSLDYLEKRHGITKQEAKIEPQMVVVHWTAVYNLEDTYEVFNPVYLGGRPDLNSASSLNVSAHFLVDRDGAIFRLLPDTTFARHTIGLNYMSIGIENIGGPDAPLTRAQLKANADLINFLAKRHDISYVIGHHEYQAFRGSILWKETDHNYLTEKNDPGDAFMRKLRKRLGSNRFKSKP